MVVDTINTTSDVLIPTEAAPKVGEDATSPLSIQTVEPLKDDNNLESGDSQRDEFRDAGNSTPCDSIQNYAMDLAASKSKEVSVVEDIKTDDVESSESIPPPPPAVVEVRDEPDATKPVETEVAAPDVTITVTSSNEKLEEEKDKESSGDNNMQCLNTDSVEIVLPDCGCDAGAAFGTNGEEEEEKPAESEDVIAEDKDTAVPKDETEGKPMDNEDVKVDNETTVQPVDEQENVEKKEEEAPVIETKDSSTASAEACSEFFVKRISSIQVKAAEMVGTFTATSDKVEDGVENEEEVPVGKSSQVTEVVTKSPEVEAAETTDKADAMPPSSESEKDASFVESLYEKIEICIGDVTSFCGPTSTKKAVCASTTVEKEAILNVEQTPVAEEEPKADEEPIEATPPADTLSPTTEKKAEVALDKLFAKPPPIEKKKTSNKAKALIKLSSMKKVASNSFQRAKKGKLVNKFKSRKGKKALSPSPVNTPSPDEEPSTSKEPIVDKEAAPITTTNTAENEESKDVVEEKIDDSPSDVKYIDESTMVPVEPTQTVENVVEDSLAEEESPKEEEKEAASEPAAPEDSKVEESSD